MNVINHFSNAIVVSDGDSVKQHSNTPRNRVIFVHEHTELFPPIDDQNTVVISENPSIEFERSGENEIKIWYEYNNYPIRLSGEKVDYAFKVIDTYENGEQEYALEYMERVLQKLAEETQEALANNL